MKVSELVKILKKNKCYLLRHGKNHDIWCSRVTGKQFSIPRHPAQDVPKGTFGNGGCYTCGDSIEQAIEMAEDALALVLYGYEAEGKEIPKPSSRESIEVHQGEFVNDIRCDTLAYRKMYNNKSVRKNVTLPEWLKINFSQVLQEALLQKLGRT